MRGCRVVLPKDVVLDGLNFRVSVSVIRKCQRCHKSWEPLSCTFLILLIRRVSCVYVVLYGNI